jgi:uncharacterized membrane protein YcaP (DUF421 family)
MIILRSAGLLVLLLLIIRIMGIRQASRMTLFDFVWSVVLGVTVASIGLNIIDNLLLGLTVLLVWSLLPALVHILALKSKKFREIVHGKETVLINNGKLLEDKLTQVRLTSEDLLSQLRKKSVFNFADVEFAVLEPDGEVSVLLKKDKQPVSAKTIGIAMGQETSPQTVILDGIILNEPLASMGLNKSWLAAELDKLGVATENVFMAQVDSYGQLYLDLFDDAINLPQPKTKELVFVNLKKCRADCELYALGTNDSKARSMFSEAADTLGSVVMDLEPWLKK